MKCELKRLGLWSVVKISFVVNLVLGFLLGIFYALFIMMLAFAPMTYMPRDFDSDFPMAVGGVMMIILPIFMAGIAAVMNTILALIGALVYNLAAKLFGGLECELEVLGGATVTPATESPQSPQRPPEPPHTPETGNLE
jgi:hypothetical protein